MLDEQALSEIIYYFFSKILFRRVFSQLLFEPKSKQQISPYISI